MRKLTKIIKQISDERLIKVVNQLILVATIFTLCGLSIYITMPHADHTKTEKGKRGPYFEAHDFVVPLPENDWWNNLPTPTPTPRAPMPTPNPVLEVVDNMVITYTTMEFEYVGRHFITAYCPSECGYNGNNYPVGWTTSSGTICHYSDDWKEPTTCAIDRNFHKYGEIILIGDPYDPDNRKIYITEDTGPGVKGLWVDCFVETMSEVKSWNTRYDRVYNVTYVTHTTTVGAVRGYWVNARMVEFLKDQLRYPYSPFA